MAFRFSSNPSGNSRNKHVLNIFDKANSGDTIQLKSYLQENCLSIDLKDCNGSTALYLAAENGDVTALTTLIAAGADVNISKSCFTINTPVMVASEMGHLNCLQALIKAGARLDYLNENGKPVLLLASNFGCFKALINGGACVNQRTREGVPLIALVSGVEKRQALIQAGANVHAIDVNGKTVLMHTTDIDSIKMLVSHGVNPNIQDNNGKTALMYFCQLGSYCEKTVIRFNADQILLEAGADVDITDYSVRTALMVAAEDRSSDTVKALLKAKADPNRQDNNATTAFISACRGNDYYNRGSTVIQTLLQAGADVDITDHSGCTVLMMDAQARDKVIIEQLLQGKADPNKQDNNGTTALIYACRGKKYYNRGSTVIQTLLQAGADVDITDHSGCTVLMMDAQARDKVIIEQLLQGKADPNKQDKDGKTALMFASTKDCMKVLLSHGADVNLMDKTQCTALDYRLQEIASEYMSGNIVNSTLSLLLNSGSYPVINAIYRPCLTKLLSNNAWTIDDQISSEMKQLIRFVVCNGIVQLYPKSLLSRDKPVIKRALYYKQVDVLKYLIANCYLTQEDLADMQNSLVEIRSHSTRRHPFRPSFCQMLLENKTDEFQELLMTALRQPWPLVKLAFIAVSSALGPSPGREERIPKTGLPDRLQRMLMFQEPVSRLPVSEWEDIPLTFDPVEYETLPKPRPLLYYWPVGRNLVI